MGEHVLEVVAIQAARLHPYVDCPFPASAILDRVQHNGAVIGLSKEELNTVGNAGTLPSIVKTTAGLTLLHSATIPTSWSAVHMIL